MAPRWANEPSPSTRRARAKKVQATAHAHTAAVNPTDQVLGVNPNHWILLAGRRHLCHRPRRKLLCDEPRTTPCLCNNPCGVQRHCRQIPKISRLASRLAACQFVGALRGSVVFDVSARADFLLD